MQNQKNTSVLKLRGKYYVLASNAKHLDIKEVVKNFVKNNENLDYSDGLMSGHKLEFLCMNFQKMEIFLSALAHLVPKNIFASITLA